MNENEKQRNLHRTRDDGGDRLLGEPDLEALHAAIDDIAAEGHSGIGRSRAENDGIRYAEWPGQSPDGLKREEFLGKEPEPFEGAMDSRVPLMDMFINEDVMLCLVAMLRSQVMVKGMGGEDSQKAGKMAVLLKWILNNQLGISWIKEHVKLANYYFGDTPGAGLLSIRWDEEKCLEYREVTVEELLSLYVQMVMESVPEDADPEILNLQAASAAEDFMMALASEEAEDDVLAEILQSFFEYLSDSRAKKVVKALRAEGRAKFPAPSTKYNGVRVCAKRIYGDVFFRSGITEFDRAPYWFEVAWYSETELWDKHATHGWRKSFIEALLKHGGEDAFSEFYRQRWRTRHSMPQDYKGLYQVIHVRYQAVNSDYVPGRYLQTISKFVDEFAHDRQLMDYAHGSYDGVLYQREAQTQWVMDSRGLPEVLGNAQAQLKTLLDTGGDNALVGGLPPIVTTRRGRGDKLYIQPLRELQARRPDEYKWLEPPAYPQAVLEMGDRIKRWASEYNGRPDEGVSEEIVAIHREWKVIWWMAHVRESVRQILALYQQYMPEETLAQIVDGQGNELFASKDEIKGQFDVLFSIDMRMFDPEFMANVGQIVRDILLAIDRDRTIDPTPIVESMLYMLLPHVAEKSLRTRDAAVEDELTDEFGKYMEILGGKEPELPDDGSVDYETRLNMYRDLEEKNPQVYASLAEDRQAILQSRLQRLDVLAQQYGENVQIGRQGGREALAE